ncbi:MAG: hypothetical protein OEZ06_18250 [Myxococcales bacterium]|nr:hypothetical protein [Myxococcales bacterium]
MLLRLLPLVLVVAASSPVGAQSVADAATPETDVAAAAAGPADAPMPQAQLLLLPTHHGGVDPVVARFADRALGRAARALGYSVQEPTPGEAPPGDTPVPSLAEMWRQTHRAGVARTVSARVWAADGRYQLEVRVASADGNGPFFARGDALANDFEARVEALLQEALPAPGVTPPPPPPASSPAAAPTSPAVPNPPAGTEAALEPPPAAGPPLRRFRLGWAAEAAFGLGRSGFTNALTGPRVQWRLDPQMALGLLLAYANLPGADGRVGAGLFLLSFEHQTPIGEGGRWSVPLRLGLGYLNKNGSVLRLSSGLAVGLSERTTLAFDLVAPTFWVASGRVVASMNLGAELSVEF